ncbi:MAG: hypothetical protein IPH72_32015 [Sandaracinaceae bacterium]|nr:hypothetical protein [Sandaracinaceae bacterium]
MTASVCRLDGPPIIGDDSFLSIGPSAWATDGSLYLLDNEARCGATVTPGADCVLTMDTTLGEGGRLTLGEGMGGAPKGIVADGQGHIYVSSSMRGTHRITGTTVDYHCETMGDLSVSPNGRDGFAKWIDTVKRVTFTRYGLHRGGLDAHRHVRAHRLGELLGRAPHPGGRSCGGLELAAPRAHLRRERAPERPGLR